MTKQHPETVRRYALVLLRQVDAKGSMVLCQTGCKIHYGSGTHVATLIPNNLVVKTIKVMPGVDRTVEEIINNLRNQIR